MAEITFPSAIHYPQRQNNNNKNKNNKNKTTTINGYDRHSSIQTGTGIYICNPITEEEEAGRS